MKNIHLILTDKPSRLKQNKITKKLSLVNKGIDLTAYTPINIYITSNEEIKEGDYVCASGGFRFVKTLNNDKARTFEDDGIVSKQNPLSSCHLSNYKKIILTTDQDLIKDGVQAIDDEFLEWFVKNSSCEEVEIKEKQHFEADKSKRKNILNGVYYSYKIIIPKEEPKQESCPDCIKLEGQEFSPDCCHNHKQKANEIIEKQETLEETAERYAEGKSSSSVFKEAHITDFIAGGNWQAKKMYNEEELEQIARFGFNAGRRVELKAVDLDFTFEKWFEQFKKK